MNSWLLVTLYRLLGRIEKLFEMVQRLFDNEQSFGKQNNNTLFISKLQLRSNFWLGYSMGSSKSFEQMVTSYYKS